CIYMHDSRIIKSVGGGLALGKEGPLVHTGACIASLLGQGGSTKYHINSRWFQVFRSDRDRRDLVTCGCTAGIAAAFRAHVGGVFFALEEWKSQLMWRVFFTSAIVAVVVRTAMGWCKNGRTVLKKEKCSPCPESDPTSGIECPRPPGMYRNYVKFFCSSDNEYNDLATIFFNTRDDAIRNLFSAKTIHEYSSQSLLTFFVMFYTLAVLTFGTTMPAGQFVPSIMIGSTYGRLVGMFVVKYYKKLNIEEGMSCIFLGCSMRMTVSLCVIMVEITNNLKPLPLIMLVLLILKDVGDTFNEGLYEEQARLRGILLLESRPKYEIRNMTAKEACGSGRVILLPRVVKVSDVVSILQSNKHNGFP
ncbi:hypothetical protein S83_019561, partial [Arachis hypogaea]